MDKYKTGKFIAQLRKKKGLTQKELSDILNVGEKSVSKWERGVNAPDITILNELSIILEVSVSEILNGEFLPSTFSAEQKKHTDKLTLNIFKKNKEDSRKKYLKMFLIFLFSFLFLFSFVFTINNFNRFKVFNLTSLNKDFEISGYVIYNKYRDFIFVDNIIYNSNDVGTINDIYVKAINISLVQDDTVFISKGDLSVIFDELLPLNEYLIDETLLVNDVGKFVSDSLFVSDENIEIIISYIDLKNEKNIITIPLRMNKEYSNLFF